MCVSCVSLQRQLVQKNHNTVFLISSKTKKGDECQRLPVHTVKSTCCVLKVTADAGSV